MFKIKENQIIKGYTLFTFLLIAFIALLLGYYLVDAEIDEANMQTKRLQRVLFEEKKKIIVSEVKRVKEYLAMEFGSAESTLKGLSKEQADNAYEIMASIYEKNKDKKSDAEIKEDIKTALGGLKFFNGRGYLFIIRSKDGVWEMLPPDTKREGKSALGNKDDKKEDIFAKIKKAALADKSGSFVKYRWYVPKTNKMDEKVSFVRYFEPYDWIIGSGEYLETVEDTIKKKAVENVLQMKFGKDGHTSIYQADGTVVSIPTARYLGGQNIYKSTGADTEKARDIIDILIKQAKKGGGFYRYEWVKPSTGVVTSKIAYAEEFKEWNWIIASGVYMDDIEKEVDDRRKYIQKQYDDKMMAILYVFSAAIIFSSIVLFILNISFSKILNYYKHRLEQRNAELEELNATLEIKIAKEVKKSEEKQFLLIKQSRLAAMGEMIGNIAHQWRQPLNALGIIVQDFKIAQQYGELNEKYIDESVDKAKSLIKHMSKTIDDFRNFFSPNKQKEEFSISDKIDTAVKFILPSLSSNGIDISLDIQEDRVYLGYPNEFMQVVLNIISNAKDAIVGHKIQQGMISIKVSSIGEKSLIEISDNGGGIDKEIIDKVFDPYFTTKNKTQGTGIGLYMSKVIVEDNMGGEIIIESVDECTKVRIIL
ncbi:MAG TPA: cache domain-containing protein [Campylobacterales bacterium]|nr:cache domain-containing protein [Campylobacterales bacterium]